MAENQEELQIFKNELGEEYILLFEAPKIVPPEFRLYYDEQTGKVLFYTCDKPEGSFITIDRQTFAEARQDIRVINGKISRVKPHQIIAKLMPDNEGTKCALEDISIVLSDEDKMKSQNWKLHVYELE
jgi:hypothetical protein